MDEEDISDLIDTVLCADDLTPDMREWQSEICKFFEGGHKKTSNEKILKAFYGKLDTDYTAKTGEGLHITADENGLNFLCGGQAFSASYAELTEHVDRLIFMGAYPFSTGDSTLDDYAIPDELDEMQGGADEDETEPEEPSGPPLLPKETEEASETVSLPEAERQRIIDDYLRYGSGMAGGRLRIYKAMQYLPAKKDRVALIKKEYGYFGFSSGLDNGHRRMDASPKGLHIEIMPSEMQKSVPYTERFYKPSKHKMRRIQ